MLHTRKVFVSGLAVLMVFLLVSVVFAQSPTLQVVEHPMLGKIFTDSSGMTLYLFTKDGADVSNC